MWYNYRMVPTHDDNLVEGKYSIRDLVDMDRLKIVFEKFNRATGFTIGFLDHPGLNVLIATGWRDICTKFHRASDASIQSCKKSNEHLLNKLKEPGQLVIEKCDNGLVDCATPIIVKGKHIASLATGQLMLAPPDMEWFKRLAGKYGYDEKEYLSALSDVPVVTETQLKNVTSLLGEIAGIISELGYSNLKIKEEAESLEHEMESRISLESVLRDSERRYKALIETTDTGYVILSSEGKVIDANGAYVRLSGHMRLNEIVGRSVIEWTADNNKEINNNAVWVCLRDGYIRNLELDYVDKYGKITPVEINATVVEINGEKQILSLCRDITNRRNTEKYLKQETQLRFRAIFDQSFQFIGLMSTDGILIEANRSALSLAGVQESSVLGKPFWETPWWKHSPELQEKLKGSIKRAALGEFIRFEATHPANDGSIRHVDFSLKPVKDDKGKVVLIIPEGRDITERKLMEEELLKREKKLAETIAEMEATNKELKAAQKQLIQSEKLASIGQLAAGVAHEINNPLSFVKSNFETLLKYKQIFDEAHLDIEEFKRAAKKNDTEKVKKIVASISARIEEHDVVHVLRDVNDLLKETQEGIERIRKIVSDLRTFSRMDDGLRNIADINELLEGMLNLAMSEIKYKAEVKKEFGDIPRIRCNVQQMGQVFLNIFVNAAQAIENAGVITVRTRYIGQKIYIEIEDNGKGMSQDIMGHLFEPFFTTKEPGKGTGLGLSISYDIIKKHKGLIKAESEEGKGTKFTIELPVD